MANVIRVTGTKVVTPVGSTTLSSPKENIVLDSVTTYVKGTLFASTATIADKLKVSGAENAITTTSGALRVIGGVGIGKDLCVGGQAIVTASIVVGVVNSLSTTQPAIIQATQHNVGSPLNPSALDGGSPAYFPDYTTYDSTTHRKEAAFYFGGGVGIEKDLNVGGFIYGRISEAVTATQINITSTNSNELYYPTFTKTLIPSIDRTLYGDDIGDSGGLTYNPYEGKLTLDRLFVASSETSTSTITGAFTVSGGVGILGDVHIGGAEYVDNLYTKVIQSTTGPIQIKPESAMTEIVGDIRVLGQKPIGTAPVVTSILYVTMDGDDTNDGRAQDSSRACRTIGAALNSPYYQPGTQIRVAPGHYLEDNPLQLKPYTSIMGSDLRTTSIEPINKTQDLFHMNSGCYMAFMQFLNGRSGLLEGPYAQGFNRGAYCTAFPPLEGDDRIDLFHSPYIQNCTNLSGPWLKDGTLFVPSQTVQIPLAVGTGTWSANTTTLVINVNTGTITQGMYVNAGQQNSGFFNARTLLLANKPFLQEQVNAFIDKSFNSNSFVYDEAICLRDTGLIIDAIALDMLHNSTSDSAFTGLQYWSQDVGYTGSILNELTTTTDAINYLASLVIDTASTALGVNGDLITSITDNFQYIITVISAGTTAGITDTIIPSTYPTDDITFTTGTQAVLDNKQTIIDSVITYIDENNPTFNYDRTICARDVGFIIDCVLFDALHSSNKQSVKAAVSYYGYDGDNTLIANEIPQTTAAYNFIKSIVSKIVKAELIENTYQGSITQNVGLTAATEDEAITLRNKIDVITGIIRNGPTSAPAKVPMPLTRNNSVSVANAFALLNANKSFIQAEVIAYINAQLNNFTYSREKSFRDVGILVENISYDAAFGGNEKAIESGLAYYNGVTSVIAGKETQCISGIDYLNELCQKVIINDTCDDLLFNGVFTTATYSQVFNYNLTGGGVTSDSLNHLFDIVTDVIANGSSAAPTVYKSTGPDAAFVSAETLLHANRAFIQQDTINWINNTFIEFPFNELTCKRDTGLILDSIIADITYPTANYSQSNFAGLQYWNQDNYVGQIADEITPTINAVKYLKDLSIKIIQNITPEIDLVGRYQSIVPQVTNLEAATIDEAAIIRLEFDNIVSILGGETAGCTDRIISNSMTPSALMNIKNAYALLLANIEYMAAEVVAYVNAVTPGFEGNYDENTCKRDVGFITSSIAFDLLHGGNRQSIQAGLSYYGLDGSASTIQGQEIQTSDAFTYLSNIVSDVVQNIPVTPLQTGVKQVLTLPESNSITADLLAIAVSTITNIISNGPAVASDVTPIAMTATTATAVFKAIEILTANRNFIITETLQYINDTYNTDPFVYNEATCYRDTGLIVDAIAYDMLYNSTSESTFAGIQYYNQSGAYVPNVGNEISTITNAIQFLQTSVGSIATTAGGAVPASNISSKFDIILDIINNGLTGVTDEIVQYSDISTNTNVLAAYYAVQAAKTTLQTNTINHINTTNPGFVYNESTCYRDIGYMIDSVCFDLLRNGNKQSIKSGVYYYSYALSTTRIPNEVPQTSAAYEFIASIVPDIVKGVPIFQSFQTGTTQITQLSPATDVEAAILQDKIDVIVNIIKNGPSEVTEKTPIDLSISTDPNVAKAFALLEANRMFIQDEVTGFIQATFKTKSFQYNQELCYRDTGLIIDAVSQDILLGGNQKSVEAGLAYWNKGYNYVTGQETTTTMAINYARNLALKIIANEPVTPQSGTYLTQVINPFFQYGGDYIPQEAVRRNFNIITTIIDRGPLYAPPVYAGGGVIALTGINGADVKISPKVVSVSTITTGTYLVGLNTSTIGFGNNATLYFGDVLVFPYQTDEVESISLEYTGNTSTWDSRKVDPIGAMGGSLVDGKVISSRSPIQSFVYDAFTQLTQGGRGIHITNDGYAQLVSVFSIFTSVGVQTDNGGIASIVNSNANFGDICLLSKGYGARRFTGHLVNPPYRSYPFSPGDEGLDQYYPNGFWPNSGKIEVFLPDLADRPHISLVMEVVPPDSYTNYAGEIGPYINEQGFSGFLNATPSLSILQTGTITITGINTDGIAVGNSVYVRDENGYQTGTNGLYYAATGTIVTDVGYQSVTLNQALESGGGDSNNSNYFTLYFCGNAFYTVLSSNVAENPYPVDQNILSSGSTAEGTDQVAAHVAAITYLNTLTDLIINNVTIFPTYQGTLTQTILPLVTGGSDASTFIDLRFSELNDIISAATITEAEAVIPPKLRTKTGTIPQGAGSAITLIKANLDFLAAEITAYVIDEFFTTSQFNEQKCTRDVKLILQRLIYDLETGGRYNMVYTGLSYWSRNGTHHIVDLGENVRRTDLFPDGSTVNFYQRSYISASGYVFEYVGAGTNYGALPQVGRADPVQGKETVQLDTGKVFFTSTDQNGDFRIGPGLVISQATGVLSGRTFTKSLFANMTPFILAVEGI